MLGRHPGHRRYTVGQRRGLNLQSADPLYVLSKDAETATVTVGPREALDVRRLDAVRVSAGVTRAFEAGWGGVVTKTIGLHPVINVKGPKTKFIRATPEAYHLSIEQVDGRDQLHRRVAVRGRRLAEVGEEEGDDDVRV